jgi:hypothetical protein
VDDRTARLRRRCAPGRRHHRRGDRGLTEIYDVTNGTVFANSPWCYITNKTGNTVDTVHADKTASMSVNGTLAEGHEYTIVTVIEISAVAQILAGATSGVASASLKMATGGDQATLVSIPRT